MAADNDSARLGVPGLDAERMRAESTDRESEIESQPHRCQLYIAGHSVHWIQAKLSLEEAHRQGRLIAVDGDLLTVDFGDEVKQYRNCTANRLLEIVGVGGDVSICEGYSVLRTPSSDGHYLFCIADVHETWVPCDYSPLTSSSPEGLAQRVETHGGFMVSGEQVMRELGDAPR